MRSSDLELVSLRSFIYIFIHRPRGRLNYIHVYTFKYKSITEMRKSTEFRYAAWTRVHQPFSKTFFVFFLRDVVNLNVTQLLIG